MYVCVLKATATVSNINTEKEKKEKEVNFFRAGALACLPAGRPPAIPVFRYGIVTLLLCFT
jgi:hypothetical protein